MVGIAAALVAVITMERCMARRPPFAANDFGDDVCWRSSTRSRLCSCDLLVTFLQNISVDFRRHRHGLLADMARIVRGQTLSLKT